MRDTIEQNIFNKNILFTFSIDRDQTRRNNSSSQSNLSLQRALFSGIQEKSTKIFRIIPKNNSNHINDMSSKINKCQFDQNDINNVQKKEFYLAIDNK
jgi:hypothetical protein